MGIKGKRADSGKGDVNEHNKKERYRPSRKGKEKAIEYPGSEIENAPYFNTPGSHRSRSGSMRSQEKQAMGHPSQKLEPQNLIDAVAKRIMLANKAKMNAFKNSFRSVYPSLTSTKPEKPEHNRGEYPQNISVATGSSAAVGPQPKSQRIGTYGPFESASYAQLPAPCGSFENESYITRLCHNEDHTPHVDEEPIKMQFFSTIFKK